MLIYDNNTLKNEEKNNCSSLKRGNGGWNAGWMWSRWW